MTPIYIHVFGSKIGHVYREHSVKVMNGRQRTVANNSEVTTPCLKSALICDQDLKR